MTRDEARAHNFREFMEHGPGLRTSTRTWIDARAPGFVLIGGLGALGCGQMWVKERPEHRELPGYDDAEIVGLEQVPLDKRG